MVQYLQVNDNVLWFLLKKKQIRGKDIILFFNVIQYSSTSHR
jgi:hypothetical protein